MKNIILIISTLLLMGCSQNNGHVGPIYGAWTLLEMSADGQQLPIEGESTVFSFQGEIVQITHMLSAPDVYTKNFGNFSIDQKELTFQFQSGLSGDEGYQYTAPAWLYFPSDGMPFHIQVTDLGTRNMDWQFTTSEGTNYHYKFKKTW